MATPRSVTSPQRSSCFCRAEMPRVCAQQKSQIGPERRSQCLGQNWNSFWRARKSRRRGFTSSLAMIHWTNAPRAYIGETEVISDRLRQHKSKEFWVSAIVFVSKDENLTKAHIRYLESRLLGEAATVNRFTLEQNQAGGSKLPESDLADMEVFLARTRQLLRSSDPTF
jgi:hypothetical protein